MIATKFGARVKTHHPCQTCIKPPFITWGISLATLWRYFCIGRQDGDPSGMFEHPGARSLGKQCDIYDIFGCDAHAIRSGAH